MVTNQPVVIDNGSGVVKAGFAGEMRPKASCTFSNFIGRPKHLRVMVGDLPSDVFVGKKAEEYRGLLRIKYPMEHGVVDNWDDMEILWNYLYGKEQLNIMPEEHPVLLTEAPLNPRKNREKAAQIMFEHLNVPALFMSMQAVLALYASARTTGVVLDSGDGVTHAVPVYEGFAMNHSIQRVDIAGRDITRYLQLLLRKEGHVFRTSAEFEIVRTIKEKHCYVPLNPQKEEQLEIDRGSADHSDVGAYNLPDGKKIHIGAARFRAPEVLFDPSLIGEEQQGVHNVLANSVLKSDMDLRRTLWANIVLSGGTTLMRDFGPRLLTEIKKDAPKDIKIKISAPQDRLYSTWSGGSILASLSTFKKIWVSRKVYEEEGPRCLHSKAYL
jgi:centractin